MRPDVEKSASIPFLCCSVACYAMSMFDVVLPDCCRLRGILFATPVVVAFSCFAFVSSLLSVEQQCRHAWQKHVLPIEHWICSGLFLLCWYFYVCYSLIVWLLFFVYFVWWVWKLSDQYRGRNAGLDVDVWVCWTIRISIIGECWFGFHLLRLCWYLFIASIFDENGMTDRELVGSDLLSWYLWTRAHGWRQKGCVAAVSCGFCSCRCGALWSVFAREHIC